MLGKGGFVHSPSQTNVSEKLFLDKTCLSMELLFWMYQVHDKIWPALLDCRQKLLSNPSFNSKLVAEPWVDVSRNESRRRGADDSWFGTLRWSAMKALLDGYCYSRHVTDLLFIVDSDQCVKTQALAIHTPIHRLQQRCHCQVPMRSWLGLATYNAFCFIVCLQTGTFFRTIDANFRMIYVDRDRLCWIWDLVCRR